MVTAILALNGLLCLLIMIGGFSDYAEGNIKGVDTCILATIVVLGVINFILVWVTW